MKHIRLLTTDFLEIEYNLVDDILVANWAGPLTGEAIMSGYESISLFLRQQYCHKLLDNHLEVRGIWADLSAWVAQEWNPRAVGIGLRYHAFVFSKDTFSRLSTEQAVRLMKKGIVEGFETSTTAEGWLKAW